MRALLVKTSSMGDVIHAMPAVTDALRAVPGLRFDWLVEEAFAPLCALHPGVDRVFTVRMRQSRGLAALPRLLGGLRGLRRDARARRHDLVVDSQGLYKSAVLARLVLGNCHGFDRHSAREPPATLLYRHRHRVARGQHAVARQRQLFAAAFGYVLPGSPPDYGLDASRFPASDLPPGYIFFAHGTSWPNKQWPVAHWQALAALAGQAGHVVVVPGGAGVDTARAEAICGAARRAIRLPPLGLAEIARVIAQAAAVVAVDTGLGHLAAAFGVPCVSLYGPTATALTGTVGAGQAQLAAALDCAPCLRRSCRLLADQRDPAPCMASLDAAQVWARLPERGAAG